MYAGQYMFPCVLWSEWDIFISEIAQDQSLLLCVIMVDDAVVGPKILFISKDKD